MFTAKSEIHLSTLLYCPKFGTIDATKQNILKADKKEKMDVLQNNFLNNFDVSNYFNHTAGINSLITLNDDTVEWVNDITLELDNSVIMSKIKSSYK